MSFFTNNPDFWYSFDTLVTTTAIVIDRPKGTRHPRFTDFIYPFDYGYLKDTHAMDHGGIDIWIGTSGSHRIEAIICSIDMGKRDAEIKLLYACTPEEQQVIYHLHNEQGIHALLIERPYSGGEQ
jgi:inorganic pyrophosphatase